VENHRRTLKKTLIFGGIKVAFSHPSGLTEDGGKYMFATYLVKGMRDRNKPLEEI
jgi:hypothetical protein